MMKHSGQGTHSIKTRKKLNIYINKWLKLPKTMWIRATQNNINIAGFILERNPGQLALFLIKLRKECSVDVGNLKANMA